MRFPDSTDPEEWVDLKRWGEWHSRFDEPPEIHEGRSLLSRSNKDLLGFMFAEGEIVTAHANFDRVAQRCEAYKFDWSADQETHFHQSRAAFGREFDFGDGCSCAQRNRGQRLKV